MFGEDEVDAVLLGRRLVMERGDGDLAEAAEDALAKVMAMLPLALEEQASASGLLVGTGPSEGSAHLEMIRKGLRTEEKLQLTYADKRGWPSERTVWPVALGFFADAEVLAAWCELRGGFRHFRLDRIASLTPLGQRLPRRRRLLLAEWRAQEGIDERD